MSHTEQMRGIIVDVWDRTKSIDEAVEEIAALTAPAPALDAGVLRDAERYRWLAAYCRSTSEHWGGRWSIIVDGPAPQRHDSEDDFDAAIDAAMSTQAERERGE
jgi:hypothetical protein